MKKWVLYLLFLGFVIICKSPVWAQSDSAQQDKIDKAYQEAKQVQQVGPAEIKLLDHAKLNLPPNYIYVPQPQADMLMQSFGNPNNATMVGLILPANEDEDWVLTIDYEEVGYIKDDDAKNWNVDELLNSIKEGTKEDNKERREQGFSELEFIGWIEKPRYDPERHHLIWSTAAKDKAEAEAETGINYNTYVLGREGYIALTLITELGNIGAEKPVAVQLLNATEFVPGKRYEDFNASTDKIAQHGLAALIAGVAAKKPGLFALIAAFMVKFAKIIGVAVFAAVIVLRKFFRRNKKEDTA
jgi:uncharacterized membrane-anchored protein